MPTPEILKEKMKMGLPVTLKFINDWEGSPSTGITKNNRHLTDESGTIHIHLDVVVSWNRGEKGRLYMTRFSYAGFTWRGETGFFDMLMKCKVEK